MHQRGFIIPLILIFFGVIIALVALGFFRSEKTLGVNYKNLIHVDCGLTVKTPKVHDTVTFPIKVSGYINGCGWLSDGNSGGTVTLIGTGGALSNAVPLSIAEASTTDLPLYFEAKISPAVVPHDGTGVLFFRNTASPTPETFQIPVNFAK